MSRATEYHKYAVVTNGSLQRLYWQHPDDGQVIEMPELLPFWKLRGFDDKPLAEAVEFIHLRGYHAIVDGVEVARVE